MIRVFSVLVALAEVEPRPKVLLLPFAPLGPNVTLRQGAKASAMLSTELKSTEKFELVEVKNVAPETGDEPLQAARQQVNEAKELRAKKKFRLAEEALQKAIAMWRDHASHVTDVSEVVDAMALLSAVQFNTGRDDEGAKSLSDALALAPDREWPLAQTSALFAKVVSDARKALRDGPKGVLTLESVPPNAAVAVDGVMLGGTPLRVREVPWGPHFWRAQLPNGELVGGVVKVESQDAVLKILSPGTDAEARLLMSLAQNKLDADALVAARDAAHLASADVAIFGALSNEGKGLALDAFSLTLTSNEVRRLPRATFDAELLSAGLEFYSVAGEVAKKGSEAGAAVKIPTVISASLAAASSVAEVRYGQAPGREAAEVLEAEAAGRDEPRREQRRVPLKKK